MTKKPNKRAAAVAAKLREARLGAGLSQIEAARKLGRPQSYISRCETGEHKLGVVELEEFASAYKKQLQFFLTVSHH